MSEKRPFEDQAGPWVAWVEQPHPIKEGERYKSYLRQTRKDNRSWTTDPDDAARFDTKREAEQAVAGPRTPGVKRGASKVSA